MKLTNREYQTLSLLAQDKSVKQIAAEFCRSVFTVQAQIKNAKLKLGVCTAHGAVAKILSAEFLYTQNKL